MVMEINLISDASEGLTREEEFLQSLVIPRKDHLFTLKSIILSHGQEYPHREYSAFSSGFTVHLVLHIIPSWAHETLQKASVQFISINEFK